MKSDFSDRIVINGDGKGSGNLCVCVLNVNRLIYQWCHLHLRGLRFSCNRIGIYIGG